MRVVAQYDARGLCDGEALEVLERNGDGGELARVWHGEREWCLEWCLVGFKKAPAF